jgi:hypothetical protein
MREDIMGSRLRLLLIISYAVRMGRSHLRALARFGRHVTGRG